MSTGTDLSGPAPHRKPVSSLRWRPGRNVIALSAVSFLTDASSEMIAPLLPLFLTGTLVASVVYVGIIEGAAESVASLLKLASGWLSDRLQRRKPLIVAGYALASTARPLVAFAGSAAQVLAIRLVDRVGKGIRGAPRDALLAESTDPAVRGLVYGFHRAADHAGAVAGPLLAMFCLSDLTMPIRDVFLAAAVPGALAVLVAVVWVREDQHGSDSVAAPDDVPAAMQTIVPSLGPSPVLDAAPTVGKAASAEPLGVPFRNAMLAIVLFTLGNSTDAFLLLRANQLGVPVAFIPLLWIVLHGVKMLSSAPGGSLSDRVGRRPLIVAGWVLYALVYAGFALASSAWHAWALFAIYGVVFGLTEGAEKALVADLVPVLRRGAAFGWYHAMIGMAALPASVMFGLLWDRYGAPAAFASGSTIALLAALAFLRVNSSGNPGGYSDR